MSLFLHRRPDSKYWWVKGRVYLADKHISIRESTKCIAKRDAKEVGKSIEEQALTLLKGNGIPVVAFSASVIKWTELQHRSNGDLWNAERLLRFLRDKDIFAITLDDWQRFTIKHLKNYKPSSYNRVRDTFQAVLKVSELIVHNKEKLKDGLYIPIRAVKGERNVFLQKIQREILFSMYPWWLLTWAIAMAYQGFRKGEARLLEWNHINFQSELITLPKEITKSDKIRYIDMHPRFTKRLLKEERRHERFVFVNHKGQPYAEQGPYVAHKTAIKKANVKLAEMGEALIPNFTIHDWRHDFGSTFMMSGGDVRSLQKLGGWGSLDMVQKYADVSNEQRRAGIRKMK